MLSKYRKLSGFMREDNYVFLLFFFSQTNWEIWSSNSSYFWIFHTPRTKHYSTPRLCTDSSHTRHDLNTLLLFAVKHLWPWAVTSTTGPESNRIHETRKHHKCISVVFLRRYPWKNSVINLARIYLFGKFAIQLSYDPKSSK